MTLALVRPFTIIDAEQRSELWFTARLGRLTGSRAADMLATIKSGEAAARRCAVGLLAQMQTALGSLDKVLRVVKLGVFVNSTTEFTDHPKVANGASDLMVAVFGDAGRHARSAVGMAELPFDIPVEIEGECVIVPPRCRPACRPPRRNYPAVTITVTSPPRSTSQTTLTG